MMNVLDTLTPSVAKTCCAGLWSHPGIRLLLGDGLHPGGEELTRRALDRLGLDVGSRVVDVGCGPGASAAVMRDFGLATVGVDYSADLASEAAGRREGSFLAGDAERLPLKDGCTDGVIVECVLSTLPDKAAAAREFARVIRPGGRIALSDVSVDGPLPAPLDQAMSWIACVAGGLPAGRYLHTLADAGFDELESEDRRVDLAAMVRKARRRLAMLQTVTATGVADFTQAGFGLPVLEVVHELLAATAREVEAGRIGYVLVTATRSRA